MADEGPGLLVSFNFLDNVFVDKGPGLLVSFDFLDDVSVDFVVFELLLCKCTS
jgi:hypothetical protein